MFETVRKVFVFVMCIAAFVAVVAAIRAVADGGVTIPFIND